MIAVELTLRTLTVKHVTYQTRVSEMIRVACQGGVAVCMYACMQDVVAGDGTTSVVVICGALLKKSLDLLHRGLHPTVISDAFSIAAQKAIQARPAQHAVQSIRCMHPPSALDVGSVK